jgi:hypothetical protein
MNKIDPIPFDLHEDADKKMKIKEILRLNDKESRRIKLDEMTSLELRIRNYKRHFCGLSVV